MQATLSGSASTAEEKAARVDSFLKSRTQLLTVFPANFCALGLTSPADVVGALERDGVALPPRLTHQQVVSKLTLATNMHTCFRKCGAHQVSRLGFEPHDLLISPLRYRTGDKRCLPYVASLTPLHLSVVQCRGAREPLPVSQPAATGCNEGRSAAHSSCTNACWVGEDFCSLDERICMVDKPSLASTVHASARVNSCIASL